MTCNEIGMVKKVNLTLAERQTFEVEVRALEWQSGTGTGYDTASAFSFLRLFDIGTCSS